MVLAVLGVEPPVDGGLGGVALDLIGVGWLARRCAVSSRLRPWRQAAGPNTLNSISAMSANWRAWACGEIPAVHHAPSFGGGELVEGGHTMGIQIVQHHSDHRSIGVGLIQATGIWLAKSSMVTSLGDRHVSPARQGFAGQEDVARTSAAILTLESRRLRLSRVIALGWAAWCPCSSRNWVEVSSKADHRPVRVVGLSIQVHCTSSIGPRIHPLPWGYTTPAPPRMEDVFLSLNRTVSWDRDSHHCRNSTTCRPKDARPVVVAIGRWAAFARAIRWASPLSSSFRYRLAWTPVQQHAIYNLPQRTAVWRLVHRTAWPMSKVGRHPVVRIPSRHLLSQG